MPLPDRRQKLIRLLPEQVKDLETAVKRCGSTEQSFMSAAVMRAVEDVLQRQEEVRERRKGTRDARRRDLEEPVGLGLGSRRRGAEASAPPSAPPGVTINVGPGAGTSDAASKLAAWVIAGPGHREPRLREAAEILRVSAGTKEEGDALVAQLEAAVAVRGQQEQKKGGLSALLRGDGLSSLKDLLGS